MGDYKPLNNVDVPITIVGAGPVGMLLALQLDRLGIPHLLTERNLHTTKWPKMDLTSTRSMEILRVLGLADEYRALEGSVDLDANFDSVFFTRVLGEGRKVLGEWVCYLLLILLVSLLLFIVQRDVMKGDGATSDEIRNDHLLGFRQPRSARTTTAASPQRQDSDARRSSSKLG